MSIGSVLVLLAFAFTISLPADKAPTTVRYPLSLFTPVCVVMVIALVFGSMYLFKAVMDKDVSRADLNSRHA
jgi:hypothetical protein